MTSQYYCHIQPKTYIDTCNIFVEGIVRAPTTIYGGAFENFNVSDAVGYTSWFRWGVVAYTNGSTDVYININSLRSIANEARSILRLRKPSSAIPAVVMAATFDQVFVRETFLYINVRMILIQMLVNSMVTDTTAKVSWYQ